MSDRKRNRNDPSNFSRRDDIGDDDDDDEIDEGQTPLQRRRHTTDVNNDDQESERKPSAMKHSPTRRQRQRRDRSDIPAHPAGFSNSPSAVAIGDAGPITQDGGHTHPVSGSDEGNNRVSRVDSHSRTHQVFASIGATADDVLASDNTTPEDHNRSKDRNKASSSIDAHAYIAREDIEESAVELEQKREASRISSRRSQERQRIRIVYLTQEETRLLRNNHDLRIENQTFRNGIMAIREFLRLRQQESSSASQQITTIPYNYHTDLPGAASAVPGSINAPPSQAQSQMNNVQGSLLSQLLGQSIQQILSQALQNEAAMACQTIANAFSATLPFSGNMSVPQQQQQPSQLPFIAQMSANLSRAFACAGTHGSPQGQLSLQEQVQGLISLLFLLNVAVIQTGVQKPASPFQQNPNVSQSTIAQSTTSSWPQPHTHPQSTPHQQGSSTPTSYPSQCQTTQPSILQPMMQWTNDLSALLQQQSQHQQVQLQQHVYPMAHHQSATESTQATSWNPSASFEQHPQQIYHGAGGHNPLYQSTFQQQHQQQQQQQEFHSAQSGHFLSERAQSQQVQDQFRQQHDLLLLLNAGVVSAQQQPGVAEGPPVAAHGNSQSGISLHQPSQNQPQHQQEALRRQQQALRLIQQSLESVGGKTDPLHFGSSRQQQQQQQLSATHLRARGTKSDQARSHDDHSGADDDDDDSETN